MRLDKSEFGDFRSLEYALGAVRDAPFFDSSHCSERCIFPHLSVYTTITTIPQQRVIPIDGVQFDHQHSEGSLLEKSVSTALSSSSDF